MLSANKSQHLMLITNFTIDTPYTHYCQSWTMSGAGCASGKADIRKGKTAAAQQLGENGGMENGEEWETWDISPTAPGWARKEGRRSSRCSTASPCSLDRPTEKQAVPWSPQAPCGADLHMQTWRSSRGRIQCKSMWPVWGDAAHEVKKVQSLLLTLCDNLNLVNMYSVLNWRWIPFLIRCNHSGSQLPQDKVFKQDQ